MQQFLIKVGLFCGILILYMGGTCLANRFFIERSVLEDRNVLILGDSHLETSLDPRHFHDAINIAQSAEPYVLSYWKLKKYLKHATVDTVLLGFSYHNISRFNDLKFSDAKLDRVLFRYSYAIEDFASLDGELKINKENYYLEFLKNMAVIPRVKHDDYIGAFRPTYKSDVTGYKKAIKRHYYPQGEYVGVSEIALRYLDLIIQLCEEQGIYLGLVTNPLHQNYLSEIPEEIANRFYQEKQRIAKKKQVSIFDFSAAPFADKEFLNADHLNLKGAKKFTEIILQELEKL